MLLKVPEDMQDKEFAAILQDEPMQPLALVPLTEEEQVCPQRSCSQMHINTHIPVKLFNVTCRQPKTVDSSGCGLMFLPFALPVHSFPAEKFLHVCEQCGCAQAHGKRNGRDRPSWSGPRERGHTGRPR